MTHLDRLEALAEKINITAQQWLDAQVRKPTVAPELALLAAIPNLVRVARAAMHIAWSEIDGPCWCQESPELTHQHTSDCLALKDALAPLYRKVEE